MQDFVHQQQLGAWGCARPSLSKAFKKTQREAGPEALNPIDLENPYPFNLAFVWLALRTLTFWGFYMNCNKEAKSLTFGGVQKSAKFNAQIPNMSVRTSKTGSLMGTARTSHPSRVIP